MTAHRLYIPIVNPVRLLPYRTSLNPYKQNYVLKPSHEPSFGPRTPSVIKAQLNTRASLPLHVTHPKSRGVHGLTYMWCYSIREHASWVSRMAIPYHYIR